jgi:tRNA(fMet)-specific endonuclease VapC
MILLDTDMLTLLLQGHPRVQKRMQSAETDVATTVITWMEVMQGRFQAIFTAADADQLERASRRLEESVSQLSTLPIVPINRAVAKQFAALLANKKLKRIGRGDVLIASIALAEKARLITRNARDFSLVPGLMWENWAD